MGPGHREFLAAPSPAFPAPPPGPSGCGAGHGPAAPEGAARWRPPLALLALALLFVGAVVGAGGAAPAVAFQETFDVIIVGGRVFDGTGNPWFRADVAVRDGRIVAVGDLDGAQAATRLDAGGLVVTPGFIDIHSHADEGDESLAQPATAAALNLVSQGITTVVVGQDGRCRCPVGERTALYRSQGIGPNVVQMVGHGTIRSRVVGREARRASEAELEQMEDLVRQNLRQGAAGLSTGLEYVPGRYADTDEVIRLAAVVADHGGFYISHERSEGRTPMWWLPSMGGRPPDLIDAVQETLAIGEATGIPVVASHIKVKGADYWGAAPAIVRLIREARERGVQAYTDQYPYTTTGSDGSTVLIPGWALAPLEGEAQSDDGEERRGFDAAAARRRLQARLDDPEIAARIRADIAHEISRRGGPDRLLVLESHVPEYAGRHLAEVAALQGMEPVELAISFQLEGLDRRGGVALRGFSLDELDTEIYMQEHFTATSTDAGIAVAGEGRPHPRFYGTYPRRLRHYALDRGVGTLAHAVRSATSLPAQIVGLTRRGAVRPGMAADLVVIDLADLADHATAMDPHRYSTGVRAVLVNGEFVVRDGATTGALPGRVLDGDELAGRPAPVTAGDT